MIRLAISPSQNTGIEMPIRPRIISAGSIGLPRVAAATTPMATPRTTQMSAAPMTSEKVAGAARAICGMTSEPRLTNDSRSRLTNSFSIIFTYWTGSGRSKPKSLRTASSVAWSALRPAMRAAGSTPGVAKKITNTNTLIANSTNTIESRRRTAKRSISSPAPQLGARVERLAHAVAEHVERQHRHGDGDARARWPRAGRV